MRMKTRSLQSSCNRICSWIQNGCIWYCESSHVSHFLFRTIRNQQGHEMEAKYLMDVSLDTKQKNWFCQHLALPTAQASDCGTWPFPTEKWRIWFYFNAQSPKYVDFRCCAVLFCFCIWALSCVILNSCSNSRHIELDLFTNGPLYQQRTITQAVRLKKQSLGDFSEEAPHSWTTDRICSSLKSHWTHNLSTVSTVLMTQSHWHRPNGKCRWAESIG